MARTTEKIMEDIVKVDAQIKADFEDIRELNTERAELIKELAEA